jgi:RHS repeat-associated protein
LITHEKNDSTFFAYTGKLTDNVSGLQWNINRWYDANVGRWVSEDPIGFRGEDINLFRYGSNVVTTLFDVDGLVACPGGRWNFWGAMSGFQVIAGYSYANVTFYCQKGHVTKEKVYTCCSVTYKQKYLKLAMAQGSIHTAMLGVGVGAQAYRYVWGTTTSAPDHTDLAGWGWFTVGFSADALVLGGEYSGGPGGGNVGGGLGLGLGVSVSLQFGYTTVSYGYHVFEIMPLDKSTQRVINSQNCTESFENVDPPIEEDINAYAL